MNQTSDDGGSRYCGSSAGGEKSGYADSLDTGYELEGNQGF